MSGVFGQTSGSFGSSSQFGNSSKSSHNPFAPNSFGTSTFPSLQTQGQGSVFGGSSTGAFGVTSSSYPTQTFVFGQTSGSFGSSSTCGNTTLGHNPFASNTAQGSTWPSLPTQNSFFSGTSTGVFGNPSFSSLACLPTSTFGRETGPSGSSSVISQIGTPSNNSFSTKAWGIATKAGGPRVSTSSPTTLGFGYTSTGSSAAVGLTSSTSNNTLAFKPFGIATGSNFGQTSSNSPFGNTVPVNPFLTSSSGVSTSPFSGKNTFASNVQPFTFGTNTASSLSTTVSGSNLPFQANVQPFQTQTSAFSVEPSCIQNKKGTKIPSYALTFTKEGEKSVKLISISAMNNYGSKSHEELRWEDYELKSGGSLDPSCNQNKKGTKIESYARTFTKEEGEKSVELISISAMPIYESKCHEELRWEDYELKSGGEGDLRSNNAHGIFSNVDKHQSAFSFPSLTTPFNSISPSFTASKESTTSSLFAPQVPVFPTLAPSTHMNTSIYQTPPSLSSPSPNFMSFSTKTQAFNSTESTPSILQQGPTVPLASTPGFFTSPSISKNALLSQASSTGFSSFSTQPRTALAPSTATGLGQTIPAQSALMATPFGTGDNNGGVSTNCGEGSLSQQLASTCKVTDSIIAVRDPFGSQDAISQPSMGHSGYSSFIQHGISSMPVRDKPVTTKVSSILTSRHLALRPLTVHVRKYHPKNDGPKVAFFDHFEETRNTHKEYNYFIPRENPRSVFGKSTDVTHVTATEDEASPLIDNASSLLSKGDNLGEDKEKNDQIHHSESSSHDTGIVEVYEAPKEIKEEPINENSIIIKPLIPKLERPDYYTKPTIQELESIESSAPGFCAHVKDFVVGRHGYGWVKFDGETDVRGLDLDALVHFNYREVIVYSDESEKPRVGQRLNKPAEITLLNLKCSDKKSGKQYTSGKIVDMYTEKLKKVAYTEFVSHDPIEGQWTFRVKHF